MDKGERQVGSRFHCCAPAPSHSVIVLLCLDRSTRKPIFPRDPHPCHVCCFYVFIMAFIVQLLKLRLVRLMLLPRMSYAPLGS